MIWKLAEKGHNVAVLFVDNFLILCTFPHCYQTQNCMILTHAEWTAKRPGVCVCVCYGLFDGRPCKLMMSCMSNGIPKIKIESVKRFI